MVKLITTDIYAKPSVRESNWSNLWSWNMWIRNDDGNNFSGKEISNLNWNNQTVLIRKKRGKVVSAICMQRDIWDIVQISNYDLFISLSEYRTRKQTSSHAILLNGPRNVSDKTVKLETLPCIKLWSCTLSKCSILPVRGRLNHPSCVLRFYLIDCTYWIRCAFVSISTHDNSLRDLRKIVLSLCVHYVR